MMEGRWTITVDRHGDIVDDGTTSRTDEVVPVVPCDEEAIERGVLALHTWMPYSSEIAREAVEAVLRAAAGTQE